MINKRNLPWRQTNDAYKIWLSEIILQQTRVNQGLPYYLKFEENFPTVHDFAQASEEKILQLWQGLGYYSRGRNMLKCAHQVVNEFGGKFPNEYSEIVKLKGIGDYTASAILSFAYNLPHAVVDGNVYRLLSRYYGIDTPINSTEGQKLFKALANEVIDRSNPAQHNQAIMEFGALQCTPKQPKCSTCPLAESCVALRTKTQDRLPVKQKAKARRKRYFNYLVVISPQRSCYLQKRTGKDIWEGLYEFPLVESDKALNVDELLLQIDENIAGDTTTQHTINKSLTVKHILSHQEIFADFWIVPHAAIDFSGNSDIFEVRFEDLEDTYAVAVLTSKFLRHFEKQQ